MLAEGGIVFDTTDFLDTLEDKEDEFSFDGVQNSNIDMMKGLNIDDEEDGTNDDRDSNTFLGLSFNILKSSMESIYENGKVYKHFTWLNKKQKLFIIN